MPTDPNKAKESDASAAAATPPVTIGPNDLVRAQSRIIELLAEWPQEYQARTLRACAVTLGIQLSGSPRTGGNNAGAPSNGGSQPRSANNGGNASGGNNQSGRRN